MLLAIRSTLLLFLGHLVTTSGLVIIESTAAMVLSYDDINDGQYSLPEVYSLEESTSNFFLSALQQDEALGDGNEALSVSVAVRDISYNENRRTVDGVVTCIYLSTRIPSDLDTYLMRGLNISGFGFANVEVSFRPYNPWVVLDNYEDTSMTSADMGLIVACVTLSIMLLVVSAVLLHVTGGWSMCQQRICNCLFEEVEDDYPLESKNTFHADSVYEDEEVMEEEVMEENSIVTGMNTNSSGVLGVQRRDGQQYVIDDENPAAGLGIHTPATRGDFDYGDETPMSTSDRPLGITSMRELPLPDTPAEKGGLAHMIMERLTHYSGSNLSGDK